MFNDVKHAHCFAPLSAVKTLNKGVANIIMMHQFLEDQNTGIGIYKGTSIVATRYTRQLVKAALRIYDDADESEVPFKDIEIGTVMGFYPSYWIPIQPKIDDQITIITRLLMVQPENIAVIKEDKNLM